MPHRPEAESPFQRALRVGARQPDDTIELILSNRPDFLRRATIAMLKREGVKLVGDPTLVERVIADNEGRAEQKEREALRRDRPKPKGRRKNDDLKVLFQAATCLKHWSGGSIRTAAKVAAAELGPPATCSTVEKALARYFSEAKDFARLLISYGLDAAWAKAQALEVFAEESSRAQRELEAIAAELRQEEAQAAARRKAKRHTACFGASAPAKIAPSKKGADH